MIKVNYNSNSIVLYSETSGSFVYIHQTYRILAFCINERYIAVIEDWQYLSSKKNLHIYDSDGKFLFDIEPAPKSLHDDGYYSSIGFEDEHILIAQSNDFVYKINLQSNEFIEKKFTK
jgi:hypothetical protein